MSKRLFSILLSALLLLSLVPMNVGALEVVTAATCGLKLKDASKPNSASNPYLVATVEDWLKIGTIEKFEHNEFFQQTADLDFSGYKYDAAAAEYNMELGLFGLDKAKAFGGTYDGAGHKITGLNMKGGDFVAPFRYAAGCTIKNLTVENSSFTVTKSDGKAGGLVGQMFGSSHAGELGPENYNVIENVKIAPTVTVTGTVGGRLGGIVGHAANNKIKDGDIGGLLDLVVKNCETSAKIVVAASGAHIFIGGAIGHTGMTKFDTFAATNDGNSRQMVTVHLDNVVSRVSITADVSGWKKGNLTEIGGLIGECNVFKAEITGCYVEANLNVRKTDGSKVEEASRGIGGVIGTLFRGNNADQSATITNNEVIFTVTGDAKADFPIGEIKGFAGDKAQVKESGNKATLDKDSETAKSIRDARAAAAAPAATASGAVTAAPAKTTASAKTADASVLLAALALTAAAAAVVVKKKH